MLANDLYQGRYKPRPIRWVDIPKPKKPGMFRRLGILALRDRVVHTALKQVLEPVLEPMFTPTVLIWTWPVVLTPLITRCC